MTENAPPGKGPDAPEPPSPSGLFLQKSRSFPQKGKTGLPAPFLPSGEASATCAVRGKKHKGMKNLFFVNSFLSARK